MTSGLKHTTVIRQVPQAAPSDPAPSLTKGLVKLLQQKESIKQQLSLLQDPDEEQRLHNAFAEICQQIEYLHDEMLGKLVDPVAVPVDQSSPPPSPDRKKLRVQDDGEEEEDPFGHSLAGFDTP